MNLEDMLGRVCTLRVTRIARADALVAHPEDARAPRLPIALDELPEDVAVGDDVEVFITLDEDGDPVATTLRPRLLRDEIGHLEVTGLAPFGAFVDWGLPKDLLIPNRHLTAPLRVGDRICVALFVDELGRLTGTTRVRERLIVGGQAPDGSPSPHRFQVGDQVDGEAWRLEDGVGLFVILQRRVLALLPAREPTRLAPGDLARLRVAQVLPDGKVMVSERAPIHEQIDVDADAVLAYLRRPNAAVVRESWDPERVAAVFGMSKKAFKRAIGRLLKEGAVAVRPDGAVVVR